MPGPWAAVSRSITSTRRRRKRTRSSGCVGPMSSICSPRCPGPISRRRLMPERSTWRWPFSRRLVATVSPRWSSPCRRQHFTVTPRRGRSRSRTSRSVNSCRVAYEACVARALVDLLVSFRDLHAVEFTALAMATVYGPRQRADGGVVGAFVHAAANATAPVIDGDGRQTRDLLYVDDAVDALARPASAAAAWSSTSEPACRHRSAISGIALPGWCPVHLIPGTARPRPLRRTHPIRDLAGTSPHPPGVVAVDRPRRRPRPACSKWSTCGLG